MSFIPWLRKSGQRQLPKLTICYWRKTKWHTGSKKSLLSSAPLICQEPTRMLKLRQGRLRTSERSGSSLRKFVLKSRSSDMSVNIDHLLNRNRKKFRRWRSPLQGSKFSGGEARRRIGSNRPSFARCATSASGSRQPWTTICDHTPENSHSPVVAALKCSPRPQIETAMKNCRTAGSKPWR